jgi:hypothetical protein
MSYYVCSLFQKKRVTLLSTRKQKKKIIATSDSLLKKKPPIYVDERVCGAQEIRRLKQWCRCEWKQDFLYHWKSNRTFFSQIR